MACWKSLTVFQMESTSSTHLTGRRPMNSLRHGAAKRITDKLAWCVDKKRGETKQYRRNIWSDQVLNDKISFDTLCSLLLTVWFIYCFCVNVNRFQCQWTWESSTLHYTPKLFHYTRIIGCKHKVCRFVSFWKALYTFEDHHRCRSQSGSERQYVALQR